MRSFVFAVLAGLVFLGASRPARAQSLYSLDATGAAPPLVDQIAGPPFGPCLYPNGPLVSSFPALPGLCPGLGPVVIGDVAVDPIMDLVFVSDGLMVVGYTSAGLFLGSYPAPIAITGLGYDAVAGLLWITDGFVYGALPPPLACALVPPPTVIGPFPVPVAPGFFLGPIGDIDWDPGPGSLWGCDAAGVVGNFMPAPFPLPGPFAFFPVPPVPCPLAPLLVGVAVDKTLPGAGIVYVTDGAMVARILPGGAPAPPTFYTPMSCFPLATPSAGLAFAGRMITYGAGADTTALPAPTIGSIGQSYVGNPGFGVTLAGSVPGGTAYLLFSVGPLCPPALAVGLPIYLGLPRSLAVVAPVGPGGGAGFVGPIPPAFPPGASIYLQWVVFTGGSIQVTSGAELTLMLP